ncbi:MAG: hypothetical protein KIS90_09530, partial [Phenylobacterium sp.]|nr:hypothetical protein [Phenylobacterium sp.]
QLVYRANIDFCHSDLRDTATGNTITVDFLSNGVSAGRQMVKGNVSDCGTFSRGYLETALTTDKVVDAVRVSTDGGDAMFIDQVRVYRDDAMIIWDGRDNGRGWCLSTDPNDHVGGWEAAASGCARSYTFNSRPN